MFSNSPVATVTAQTRPTIGWILLFIDIIVESEFDRAQQGIDIS